MAGVAKSLEDAFLQAFLGFRGLLNPLLSRRDTLPHLAESGVDSKTDSAGEFKNHELPKGCV